MFDIGFAELLLIGVVGLLVVGPEQLPGAVRTVLAWTNRFRRSFDQIRTEVRRELHNDEIMQKLKAESQILEQEMRDTAQSMEQEIQALSNEASDSLQGASHADNSIPQRLQAHHLQPRQPLPRRLKLALARVATRRQKPHDRAEPTRRPAHVAGGPPDGAT